MSNQCSCVQPTTGTFFVQHSTFAPVFPLVSPEDLSHHLTEDDIGGGIYSNWSDNPAWNSLILNSKDCKMLFLLTNNKTCFNAFIPFISSMFQSTSALLSSTLFSPTAVSAVKSSVLPWGWSLISIFIYFSLTACFPSH